jgi:hypothetical protein
MSKKEQSDISEDYVQNSQNNPHFLIAFLLKVSLDFQDDFDVRCQSMEWRKSQCKDPKMSCLQKSRMTTVLITFFNKHCVISREFVPEGQTWNIEF